MRDEINKTGKCKLILLPFRGDKTVMVMRAEGILSSISVSHYSQMPSLLPSL